MKFLKFDVFGFVVSLVGKCLPFVDWWMFE